MSNTMSDKNSVNFTRREFLGTVAAAAAFTIVPRSVLGGPGYTAPSDMVNLAGIGVGSQRWWRYTEYRYSGCTN